MYEKGEIQPRATELHLPCGRNCRLRQVALIYVFAQDISAQAPTRYEWPATTTRATCLRYLGRPSQEYCQAKEIVWKVPPILASSPSL